MLARDADTGCWLSYGDYMDGQIIDIISYVQVTAFLFVDVLHSDEVARGSPGDGNGRVGVSVTPLTTVTEGVVGKIPCALLLGGWLCRYAGSGKLICRVNSEFSSGKYQHLPVV